ncbi:unnamed protein product [Effrenium voratum]|nr:unnamed protein product [Effrenium voratum]
MEEAFTVSRVLLLVHVSPFLRDATDTAHSLAFASRVRAVDFGAQRLRQEQEDRARAAQQRSQQEARQLQQQLDQAKRELAEAQKAQSELKQQSSTLVEQLRERQRELIREQELRAKAEESAREFRLGTPRGLSGLSGLGGPAAPRALSPSRKRREKFGAVDLDKLEVKVEAPALRAPLVDRTNEDRSNEDRAALKKEVLALASPNRAKIEDVPVTPERLISCFVEPEVAAQRGIFRSPERNDPKEADRAVAREPPREPPAQVRPVLKRVPTDFKTRLLKKQEFGASLGGKRVTFAEEQTACSPPRWYLDLLEHDQEKKLEEPKASKPPRALTPPLRRNKEVVLRFARWPEGSTSKIPSSVLRSMWRRLDFNGNEIVSLAEIDKLVVEEFPVLNHKPALMRAYKAAIQSDGEGDAWVHKHEFQKLLGYLVYFNKLFWIFDTGDSDRDRRLSYGEFKWCLNAAGAKMSEVEIQADFRSVDANGGGMVLFDEFCKYFATKSCPECLQQAVF